MFNLQGSEIIVILLIALVVLGPEKLPDAVRRFSRTYNELKKMGSGFQSEFRAVIDEPMQEVRQTAALLQDPNALTDAGDTAGDAPAGDDLDADDEFDDEDVPDDDRPDRGLLAEGAPDEDDDAQPPLESAPSSRNGGSTSTQADPPGPDRAFNTIAAANSSASIESRRRPEPDEAADQPPDPGEDTDTASGDGSPDRIESAEPPDPAVAASAASDHDVSDPDLSDREASAPDPGPDAPETDSASTPPEAGGADPVRDGVART